MWLVVDAAACYTPVGIDPVREFLCKLKFLSTVKEPSSATHVWMEVDGVSVLTKSMAWSMSNQRRGYDRRCFPRTCGDCARESIVV